MSRQGSGHRQGTVHQDNRLQRPVRRRIKRLVKDAEMHSEEDKKKKELAEARNQADTLIYATEKPSRISRQVESSLKSDIDSAIDG